MCIFFFFSSRRRHTRYIGDWSSDVCSSDLFVDVGVHQDGLVHVSQLADRFVKDPNQVVKVGDRIKVRVLQIDLARKRISLRSEERRVGKECRSRWWLDG